MPWSTVMADHIAKHWKRNFPKEAMQRKRADCFKAAVEDAANRADAVLEQCAAKGLEYHQAYELALEKWGSPPG